MKIQIFFFFFFFLIFHVLINFIIKCPILMEFWQNLVFQMMLQ